MDDALLVRGFERLGNLSRDRERFIEGKWTLCDPVGESWPVNEFEDERVLFESVDPCDVLMIERGEHLRLALEPREAFGIEREFSWKNFDRDIARQRHVARTIHLAHSACADGGQNLVRTDPRSRCEWHRLSGRHEAFQLLVPVEDDDGARRR